MADQLAGLLAFPPEKGKKISVKDYDSQITGYLAELNKLPAAGWTKNVDKQNLLDVLDPAVNSLPYLFALNAQFKAAGRSRDRVLSLIARAEHFFISFDPIQIRYEGAQWYLLLETVLGFYGQQDNPTPHQVVSAMLRLDPTAGTFTSLRLDVLRFCLSAGVPSQALPLLDQHIYAFPQSISRTVPGESANEAEFSNSYMHSRSGFTAKVFPEMVLEYYLLGAQIYIGYSNFNRARLFLEYILLSPSMQHVVSGIQTEAYKKWVLLGLLSDGRTFPLPKTLDQSVSKAVRATSKAYDVLAETFEKREMKRYQAETDRGAKLWRDDGNARLVQETSSALFRFRVRDLKKTYAALPVIRVASQLDMPVDQLLRLLTDMERLGSLHAEVSGAGESAVLRFHTDAPKTSMSDSTDSLEAQTERIKALVSSIQDVDRRLQLTKEYVDNQKRIKRAGGPDGDLADAMDLTYDAPGTMDGDVGDEDIME